jgi:hypothetical protein
MALLGMFEETGERPERRARHRRPLRLAATASLSESL